MARPTLAIIAAVAVLGLLVGCDGPADPPPPGAPVVTAVRGGGPDDASLDLTVVVAAQGGPLEAEGVLLVGFPHWYYGMRGSTGQADVSARAGGVALPARRRPAEYGRWYAEARLDRAVPAGTEIEVRVTRAPPPGVPGELYPLVLFDAQGGDDPVALEGVPGVMITPAERPASRAKRTVHRTASGRTVIFADLHGHSGLSDGRGSPAGYFAFARRRGRVRVAALSDHDWQLTPREFEQLVKAADEANVPGEFVALPALEINVHGHEVAWFFDSGALRSLSHLGAGGGVGTIWQETDFGGTPARFSPRPRELILRLRTSTLTASHTTLARGMGTAAPRRGKLPGERCVEIYSAHGSSECADCARAVSSEGTDEDGPVSDVRSHLIRDPTLCLLAAGDSHDGRPGDTRWGPYPGGLTGMEVDEITRMGVLEAMRAGRTWATTGGRPILELGEDGRRLRISSDAAVAEVVLVAARTGSERTLAPGRRRAEWIDVPRVPGGSYVRVRFEDGSLAWINPRRPEPR